MTYYTRVTVWCDKEQDLDGWFRWLSERGVSCAIVDKGRYPFYSLWRRDRDEKEIVGPETEPDKWSERFRIVHSANGFETKEVADGRELVTT